MTSCTFTTGQTPSAPCWEAFTALMYPTASRAAPTRSSWPSAATLPSAAMDLCCSTQVRPLLVWRSGVHICNKGSLSLSLSLSRSCSRCQSYSKEILILQNSGILIICAVLFTVYSLFILKKNPNS